MKDLRDIIFKKCKKLSEGQYFPDRKYNQFIKNPKILSVINNVDVINDLYLTLKSSDLLPIVRTKSKGIARHPYNQCGAWDYVECYNKKNVLKGIKITVILHNHVFVFKCGAFGIKDKGATGIAMFKKLENCCKEHNINLENYAIDNGEEIKTQIESPIIKNYIQREEIEHVHHLDINSAWPAGVIKDYPELKPVFAELRKKDKYIGDIALGYCQSEHCNYKWSNLAKSGINNTNKYIDKLFNNLYKQDFDIIGINTDGIWYKDSTDQNRLYHDDNEGTEIGNWKTDHTDCTFYAESDGQYYFIENGEFNVRARGQYAYEQYKPREQWDKYDFKEAMKSLITIEWHESCGFKIFGMNRIELVGEKRKNEERN